MAHEAPGERPEPTDPNIDVVAIAASAGGIHAIGRIIGALPPNFPASIQSGSVDFTLPLDPIAPALGTLVMGDDAR